MALADANGAPAENVGGGGGETRQLVCRHSAVKEKGDSLGCVFLSPSQCTSQTLSGGQRGSRRICLHSSVFNVTHSVSEGEVGEQGEDGWVGSSARHPNFRSLSYHFN